MNNDQELSTLEYKKMQADWRRLSRVVTMGEVLIELGKTDTYFRRLRGTTIEGWVDIMVGNWNKIRHIPSIRRYIPFIRKHFAEKCELLGEDSGQ